MNVFRKGDDFIIITEVPGVKKSDLDLQVKGRTFAFRSESGRIPGQSRCAPPRAARGAVRSAVTLPVEIDPDGVTAEYRDGILALFLPRAESEKPKTIKIG